MTPFTRALLDALDEPALLIERQRVRLANVPAKDLLGQAIEDSDVRLAIRQPEALEFVLARKPGDLDFTGLGAVGRPWRLSLRAVDGSTMLLRLTDRSAQRAAEKLRVDFVANASHELRTPLTTILGYAESLEDSGLDPDAAQSVVTIRTEGQRMLGIIEDLMSLSRIEADRFAAPSDLVEVPDVVRTAVESMRVSGQEGNCTIEAELQDDLPPVSGDFPQLVQMLDNLLSNAIRYGCEKPGCEIKVSAQSEGDAVRLSVSDNGPGIAQRHLPFVTRRFYRADAARSRDTGGTGLGLAIVKHIVERHKGTLAIDSSEGVGTTVIVRLPAAR